MRRNRIATGAWRLPHLVLAFCVFEGGCYGHAGEQYRQKLVQLARNAPLHQQKRAERTNEAERAGYRGEEYPSDGIAT
jgi:hypothetical protein